MPAANTPTLRGLGIETYGASPTLRGIGFETFAVTPVLNGIEAEVYPTPRPSPVLMGIEVEVYPTTAIRKRPFVSGVKARIFENGVKRGEWL